MAYSERDGGVRDSTAKTYHILNESYEANLEFPEGWGDVQSKKKTSVGGVWMFSGTTQIWLKKFSRIMHIKMLSFIALKNVTM